MALGGVELLGILVALGPITKSKGIVVSLSFVRLYIDQAKPAVAESSLNETVSKRLACSQKLLLELLRDHFGVRSNP